MDKDDKKHIKSEIDDLINGGDDANELPDFTFDAVAPLNTAEVSNDATLKAQNLVLSCLKLYYDEKVINKNEFIAAKTAVSTSTLSTLFKQIKTAEWFIEKIVEDIGQGRMEPRLFEVATGIQSNIVDMLKNTQLHIISMHEEFKRLQNEVSGKEKRPGFDEPIDITEADTEAGGKVYTNSKALLNQLDEEDEDEEDDD
jgi:hypothetical protein